MCGFGDKVRLHRPPYFRTMLSVHRFKDRRPLAPAAVAKMTVRREDGTLVDVE